LQFASHADCLFFRKRLDFRVDGRVEEIYQLIRVNQNRTSPKFITFRPKNHNKYILDFFIYSTNIQLTARVQFTASNQAERFRVIEYFVALKKITTSCSVVEPAVTNQVQVPTQISTRPEFIQRIFRDY
jgi:hypothetical protein